LTPSLLIIGMLMWRNIENCYLQKGKEYLCTLDTGEQVTAIYSGSLCFEFDGDIWFNIIKVYID